MYAKNQMVISDDYVLDGDGKSGRQGLKCESRDARSTGVERPSGELGIER